MGNLISINSKPSHIVVLSSFFLLFILFNQGISWLPGLPQVFARHQDIGLEPTDNNTQFNDTQSDSLATETAGGLELAGVYDDPVYGTSIGFPAYWEVDDIDQNPDDDVKSIVFFYSPGNDAFVELSTEETQFPGMTEEYLDGVISNFRATFQDFQVLESSTTNVNFAGQDGYRLISTYQHNGTNYQRMETGAIIDGRPFFIVYDAEEENYSDYAPLVDLMVESLQIPSQGQESIEGQVEEEQRREQSESTTFGENATIGSIPLQTDGQKQQQQAPPDGTMEGSTRPFEPTPSSPLQSPFSINFEQQCMTYHTYISITEDKCHQFFHGSFVTNEGWIFLSCTIGREAVALIFPQLTRLLDRVQCP
jgi:hypothetical protein